MLETIDLDAISSLGYAFQVEITYRAIKAGFKVVEVPIVFRDRREGNSKMSKAIVAEAMWRVPAMRRGIGGRRPGAVASVCDSQVQGLVEYALSATQSRRPKCRASSPM